MFFTRFFTYGIVYSGIELTLLLMLASYTSWEVPLLLIFGTAMLGTVVLQSARVRFGSAILRRLRSGTFPGRELTNGTLVVVGGILLLLPGILSDVAGLLLLIPPVRWLIIAGLRRRFESGAQGVCKVTVYPTPEEPSPRHQAIDVESDHVHPVD